MAAKHYSQLFFWTLEKAIIELHSSCIFGNLSQFSSCTVCLVCFGEVYTYSINKGSSKRKAGIGHNLGGGIISCRASMNMSNFSFSLFVLSSLFNTR